jgi:hypothetical protein
MQNGIAQRLDALEALFRRGLAPQVNPAGRQQQHIVPNTPPENWPLVPPPANRPPNRPVMTPKEREKAWKKKIKVTKFIYQQ